MKALYKSGCGREGIALVDLPVPEPKPGEILVKIMAAGICGTDIHIMKEEYAHTVPVVLGHEFTGVITKLGEGVAGFEVGDQVISLTVIKSCGKCLYCRRGNGILCNEKRGLGSNINGAMAEYMVIPAEIAFKVPDNMKGSDVLVLAEPLSCCIRAVLEKSLVKAGDVAVITGPGAIGILTMQIARAQGAFAIVCGTKDDGDRLAIAKELGADVVVNDPAQLKETVQRYAPLGADVAFECSGAAPAFAVCLDVLRKMGNLAQVGLYGKPIQVDMDMVLRKEITVTTNFSLARSSMELMLKLAWQGKLNLDKIITTRLPLSEWEKGFDLFMKKEGLKIVLVP
ncbi:MAG: zinc-dependent alcohol dehydrogenase [Christensenellales bacterium]